MKQVVNLDTKQRVGIGTLVVLSIFAFQEQIQELFQGKQQEYSKHELIFLLSSGDSRVQTIGDSMAIDREYRRLGICPHFRHITSSEELLRVLQSEKYFYNGLSIRGHGNQNIINSDTDEVSFTYDVKNNSIQENRENKDITGGFLTRNNIIFRVFSEEHLAHDAQVTLFSCMTANDTIHLRENIVSVTPIAQSIANAFNRNTLAPVYSISMSGTTSKGDTIYPMSNKDFLKIGTSGGVAFDPEKFETIIVNGSVESCSAKGGVRGYKNIYIIDSSGVERRELNKHTTRTGNSIPTSPESFRLFTPKLQ